MLRRQIKRVLGPALWLRLKDLLYRPAGVRMGRHTWIFRPFFANKPHALTLGDHCEVRRNGHIEIHSTGTVSIGDGTYIGRSFYLTAIHNVTIGANCVLSDHVYITDLAHGLDPDGGPILRQPMESKGPVVIGDGCFLGFRVAVLPGVTLGEHCVVGVNAVVTRSFPAYTMLAGAPARAIKTWSHEQKQWVPVHE